MAGELRVRISAKDEARAVYRKHAQELKGLEGTMKQAAKTADSLANTFASIGTKMMLGITLPVIAIGSALAKMAMDAQESENLFGISMGNMADDARRWSEQLRADLGLNAYEIRKSVGIFHNMFTSMEIGEDASYGMSKGLTQLAYDMASFFNLRPEEAFDKIRSGIMGQSEPLRELGIIVNDTTIKQWAMKQGLIEQGEEMSEQQKVLARYMVIMEATANAQGDLARNIESPTIQWQIMQEQIKDIGITIGEEFLPIVSGALLWINNTGLPAVRGALSKAKESWEEMGDEGRQRILVIAGLLIAGGPLLLAISGAIKAIGLLAAAFTALKISAVGGLVVVAAKVVFVAGLLAMVLEGIGKAVVGVGKLFGDIGRELAKAPREFGWYDLADRLQGLESSMASVGSVMQIPMQAARDLAGSLVDFAEDPMGAFNDLAGQISSLGKDALKGLSDEIEAWADVGRKSIESVDDGIDELKDPLADIGDLWKQLAGSAKDANEKAGNSAKQAAISINDMVKALVAVHPATAAASLEVVMWERRIEDVNLAIKANQDQLKAAQAEYSRHSEALQNMQRDLSNLQSRLSELSRPKLIGMGELDTQIKAIEGQLKRLDYAELTGMSLESVIRQFPLLAEGAESFLSTVPRTREELEKMLQKLRLTGELEFDEKLRLLAEAAEGAAEEMTFEDAMTELIATRKEIGNLSGAIEYQQALLQNQQNVIKGIQEANEQLNETLRAYQAELALSQQNLKDVTDALQDAFTWLLQDREKMQEMGDEAVRQSGIVDDATRTLLQSMDQYAQDVADGVSSTLQGVVDAYRRAVDKAKSIVAEMPAMPSAVTATAGAAVTDLGGQQFGGSYRIGGTGGIDSQLIMARATPGEVVTFTPPGGGGSRPIVVNINAPVYGYDDFEDAVINAVETAERRGRR